LVANEVAAREDLLELGLLLKESAEISHVLLSCANIKAKERNLHEAALLSRAYLIQWPAEFLFLSPPNRLSLRADSSELMPMQRVSAAYSRYKLEFCGLDGLQE
jgi:hypothetical protein